MAEFNPKVDNVGSNNYINYSERYGGNQAWGTLFEGLAKGADQAVQMNLQKQVSGAVEEANNTYFNTNNITNSQAGAPGNGYEVGASDGTVTRGNGGAPGQSTPGGTDFRQLPKPLQDGQGVINNLGKAFENGTYSETNYWSQLNAKVKALKAQFPGYAEDIDRMASNALNSPTANQLRQSVYNDWVSKNSGAKTARDNDLKWLSEDSHSAYLGDDLRNKVLTGTATDEEIADAKIAVGNQVALQKGLERTKLAFEVSKLDATDKQDKALKYASSAVNNMFGDVYMRTFGATGNAYKEFKNNLAKYTADGKIDETELAELNKARVSLTDQLNAQYMQIINTPDQQGNTLAQVLGPDELDKLKKSFDSQMSIINDNFGGTDGVKKLSVLELTQTLNLAAQSSASFDVLHTTAGQEAAKVKALADASGGVYTDLLKANLAKTNANGDNPVDAALATVLANKAVGDGTALATSVSQTGSSASDRSKAVALSAAMKTSLDVMANPDAPVEQRVNALMSLYGDGNTDFLRLVSDKAGKDGWSSRERTFLDLSSPKAAAAVAELEKTNPGSLQQYYDFLTKSAPLVFKDTADSVQSADTFSKYANISINPNGQLELKLDLSKFSSPEAANAFLQGRRVGQVGSGHGPAGPAPLSPGDMIELSKIKDGVDAVHRLNIVMRGLTPALDAMGVKPEERTQYFLDTMGGIKLGAGKQLPTLDVIYNFLTKPSGPTGSTMKNPRGGTVIEDNLTPTSENLQMEGNGMIDTSFEDHMANADVPYNDAVGGSKEYNKKVPLLMGKLTSDLGLNGVQAAGLIGNLAHESAELKPHIPGDGGAAHGWAQWNGSRKRDMLKWTKANGYDPNSDDGNYAYLIHDLQNNYPKVLEHLKQAKTVEEATKIIQDEYERPGVPVYSSRLKYARKALAAAPQ